ncbi:MAG: hypothetical protein ACYC7G_09685, partial [Rudaea sp.]
MKTRALLRSGAWMPSANFSRVGVQADPTEPNKKPRTRRGFVECLRVPYADFFGAAFFAGGAAFFTAALTGAAFF